jgi:hypothetical protein
VHDFEGQRGRDSLLRRARQLATPSLRGGDRGRESDFSKHLTLRGEQQHRLQ